MSSSIPRRDSFHLDLAEKPMTLAAAFILALSAASNVDHWEIGLEHFRQARYQQAVAEWEAKAATDPEPWLLFNIAVAYDHWSGHCDQAIEGFQRFLRACRSCPSKQVGMKRLAAVEAACSVRLEGGAICQGARRRVPADAVVLASLGAGVREAALAEAKKRALLTASTVVIDDMLTDGAYAWLRPNADRFRGEAESQLEAHVDLICSADLLDELRDGESVKISAEVSIDDERLRLELSRMAAKYRVARFPRIMFVIREQYTDAARNTVALEDSTLQSFLEDQFLALGFDLVDQQTVEALRREEAHAFEDILNDDNKAALLATKYNAEYIVTGLAQVRHTSFDDLGNKEHHAYAELSLRAIHGSTGGLVASPKVTGPSPPNCYSEPDLRARTILHVAPKLMASLIQRINDSWERETQNGIRYSVKLYGYNSYADEGVQFLRLVQDLPGIKHVNRVSAAGGRLELEAFYTALYDGAFLEAAILEARSRDRGFATLDVDGSIGRQLSFRVGERKAKR